VRNDNIFIFADQVYLCIQMNEEAVHNFFFAWFLLVSKNVCMIGAL
jgi:hypothetical protein